MVWFRDFQFVRGLRLVGVLVVLLEVEELEEVEEDVPVRCGGEGGVEAIMRGSWACALVNCCRE